jgi:hypothetical protein
VSKQSLYKTLAYAGAIPFVACAVAALAGLSFPAPLGPPERLAASYGLTIVSFMAGVLWGVYLTSRGAVPGQPFLASNAVALIAWGVFLAGPPKLALSVMAVLFLYLLYVDYALSRSGALTGDYLALRRNVTAIVVLSLAALVLAT